MGILDNAGSLINKGVANAGRGTRSLALKAQIADVQRRQTTLMAQLGEELYGLTRAQPDVRAPREALYASIEELDGQTASLRAELDALERQMQVGVGTYEGNAVCPECGRACGTQDVFCARCGADLAYGRQVAESALGASSRTDGCEVGTSGFGAASATPTCASCGHVLAADDAFCANCGMRATSAPEVPCGGESAPIFAGEPDTEGSTVVEEADPMAGEAERGRAVCAQGTANEAPVCPKCGFRGDPSALFCRNCGAHL